MARTVQLWKEGVAVRVRRALIRYGQVGFWIQLVFLILVALLGGYVFLIIKDRAALGNMLAFLGLALPVFTTFWCHRYASLGRALADPASGPSPDRVRRSGWIGVWAATAGTLVSLLSLFGAASALLVTMLATPQLGLQISAAQAGANSYTVSAIDAVSIMALLLALTAELMVVAISLRIIFLLPVAIGDSEPA